jgi:hypothetical protein
MQLPLLEQLFKQVLVPQSIPLNPELQMQRLLKHLPLFEQLFGQVLRRQFSPVLSSLQKHCPLKQTPRSGPPQLSGQSLMLQSSPVKPLSQMHLKPESDFLNFSFNFIFLSVLATFPADDSPKLSHFPLLLQSFGHLLIEQFSPLKSLLHKHFPFKHFPLNIQLSKQVFISQAVPL